MPEIFAIDVWYEVRCAHCGVEMGVDEAEDARGVMRIKVNPCEKCSDAAYDQGHKEGKEDQE